MKVLIAAILMLLCPNVIKAVEEAQPTPIAEAIHPSPGAKARTFESECQERIDAWHTELRELATNRNLVGLQVLKEAVDVELALADLKIKVRQADWAKTTTWGPLVLPTLGIILGAFIGGWLRR